MGAGGKLCFAHGLRSITERIRCSLAVLSVGGAKLAHGTPKLLRSLR